MPTKTEILNDMLNEVPNTYDKRPGGFIYDSIAPVAEKLEEKHNELEETKAKLSIDNLTGPELEVRVKERTGINRRKSTFAVGKVIVTGNGMVYVGDLVETEDGIQFEATETKTIVNSGEVNIKALLAGPIGVVAAGSITLFPVTLSGINSVTNPEPTYDGFEAESDTDLLKRYYERIQTPATSANKHHYKSWAKDVEGVGDVRVFPLWAGDNTVKVVIIDADRQPASNEIVEKVQNNIDPGITGLGDGEAPIGAFCTVTSATGKLIYVSFVAEKSEGYEDEKVNEIVSNNIVNFLKTIAFDENIEYVSYAQIGSLVLNSEGIADYSNLTVNGGVVNIPLIDDEVAILGGVEIV